MKTPKPQSMPFAQNTTGATTNTYGFQSFDPENQFVRDYMNEGVEVDPGAQQRTDLAEQGSQNKWNSAFALGIPQAQRMMMQAAEDRAIRQQGAYDQQNARYRQNALSLARRERLLPQLVQTGGTQTGSSSGYGSVPGQPGFWNTLVGSFGQALGGGLGGGFI
ncbi:MAG: hypothetical protein L0Y58_22415 [Verrucomicrobia subdivision 3 bacterium]|nr:hypothetical protein [Limisphaerales bacterium]